MPTELAFLKPWITALILPPGSVLVLIALAYLMVTHSSSAAWKTLGKMLLTCSFAALWLFCCQGTAIYLERTVLRPPPAIESKNVVSSFKSSQAQAIVVLGGGLSPNLPEYGGAHLSEASAQRLHYAVMLSKISHVPLAFTGGIGWASAAEHETEAAAALRWLDHLGLAHPKWQESGSRDTAGNAHAMSQILKKDGITRIALVTHASHMPRAMKEFQTYGLNVLPAPTHALIPDQGMGLDWFPSGTGLRNTRRVLHEIVALSLLKARTSS